MALLGAAPLTTAVASWAAASGLAQSGQVSPLPGKWRLKTPGAPTLEQVVSGDFLDLNLGSLPLFCQADGSDQVTVAEAALVPPGDIEDVWARIARATPGLAVSQGLANEGYSRLQQAGSVPHGRDRFTRESLLLRATGEALLAQSSAEAAGEIAKAQREAAELWAELRSAQEAAAILETSTKRLEDIQKYARDLAMERKPELRALVEGLEGERSARRMRKLEIERKLEQGLVRLRHLCGEPVDGNFQVPGDRLEDPQMGGLPNLEESLAAAGSNGPALAELDNLVAVLEGQACLVRDNKPTVGGRDFDKLRLELSQQAEVAAGKRREAEASLRQAAAVALAALRPLYEQHRHAKEALSQAQASADVIEKFIKERRPELGPTEQLAALKGIEIARQEELKLRVAYRQALLKLDLATRPIPGR